MQNNQSQLPVEIQLQVVCTPRMLEYLRFTHSALARVERIESETWVTRVV